MEQMRLELMADGHDVQFVAINAASALADQDKLYERCSFPLIQDLDEINAWGVHHGGVKDDIYIYGSDGKLADYLPISDMMRTTDLSTAKGYDNLKSAIVAVVEQ